jgi:hypothetical protein
MGQESGDKNRGNCIITNFKKREMLKFPQHQSTPIYQNTNLGAAVEEQYRSL